MGKSWQTDRKKITRIMFICAVLSIQLSGWAQEVKNGAYQLMLNSLLAKKVATIGVAQVKQTEPIVWLDAREKNEFEVSHIKNSIWVGYEDFDKISVNHLPKDANIIVYCSVGYRSEKITEKLIELGFTNAKNLFGGIFEWVNQENPVYNLKGETKRVHAFSKTWGIWLHKGEKVFD